MELPRLFLSLQASSGACQGENKARGWILSDMVRGEGPSGQMAGTGGEGEAEGRTLSQLGDRKPTPTEAGELTGIPKGPWAGPG